MDVKKSRDLPPRQEVPPVFHDPNGPPVPMSKKPRGARLSSKTRLLAASGAVLVLLSGCVKTQPMVGAFSHLPNQRYIEYGSTPEPDSTVERDSPRI